MSSNIYTVRTAVQRAFPALQGRPTNKQIDEAIQKAHAHGHRFDLNGRGVAPWLPNVKGHRYVRGKLVPRFAHRTR